MSVTWWAIIILLLPFSGGLSFLALIVVMVFFKWKATIIAAPDPDRRTRVTANSSIDKTNKVLSEWAEEELGSKATPVSP